MQLSIYLFLFIFLFIYFIFLDPDNMSVVPDEVDQGMETFQQGNSL